METHLTRRDFLRLSSWSAALAAMAACNPLAPPSASTDSPIRLAAEAARTLHLLRRATFGPSAADRTRAAELGIEDWLEEQLTPDGDEGPAVAERLSRLETLSLSPSELAGLEENGRVVRELVTATVVRQVYSPRQLYEQMVDFWSNHFNVHIRSGFVFLLKGAEDQDVIRRHALGRFPDLLRASAHSPAMMVYLDNARSSQPSPNENYARELLELHTLGVDGGYTHADVEAVARALTGWSVTGRRDRRPLGEFIFREAWHEDGPKSVLGHDLPGGGKADGDRLLEILAEHPSTANHIARKLCVRFVADSPPQPLVEAVAKAYLDTGGEIPAMLRTIFHSEEFSAAAGQKLKRPLDYFVSSLRVLGVDGEVARPIAGLLELLGQVPFHWPAPDGYPDQAGPWLNSNQMLYRWTLALMVASGDLRGMETELAAIADEFTEPEALVDALSLHLLGAPLPADARQILLDYAPAAPASVQPQALAGLILASPHFQIR